MKNLLLLCLFTCNSALAVPDTKPLFTREDILKAYADCIDEKPKPSCRGVSAETCFDYGYMLGTYCLVSKLGGEK